MVESHVWPYAPKICRQPLDLVKLYQRVPLLLLYLAQVGVSPPEVASDAGAVRCTECDCRGLDLSASDLRVERQLNVLGDVSEMLG